jgi:hypothetical protein
MNPNQFALGALLLIQVTNIVDADGGPTTLAIAPVFSSSDPTILNPVATDSTGLSATATALKDGTVTITATSGSLTASITLTIAAGTAVSFQLTASVVPPPPVTAASVSVKS